MQFDYSQVPVYRSQADMSMQQAKRYVEKQQLIEAIQLANSLDEFREILEHLVRKVY